MVRFSTRRVTDILNKAIRNSPRIGIGGFSGVRRNGPKALAFLTGPGCRRFVCRARTDVILMGGSFAPTRPVGTALIGITGTCTSLTVLLGVTRRTGIGGTNVSTATFVTNSTAINRKYCINGFTCVNRSIGVNGGDHVCPRTCVNSRIAVNSGYAICPRTAVCGNYMVNGGYVLRTKDIVKSSNFNFTPRNSGCGGVPRLNGIMLRSSIRVKTGAAVSHTIVSSAVVHQNIGLSGLMRVTRGIRINRGAIVTTRMNVTNSMGVNDRYVFKNRTKLSKRVRITSRIMFNTRYNIVDSMGRPTALLNTPTVGTGTFVHSDTVFGHLPSVCHRVKRVQHRVRQLGLTISGTHGNR